MAKGKSRIVLSYRMNTDETYQVCVDAASSYPDSLDQAKVTAVAALKDMLADVLAATRDPAPAPVEDAEP